MPSLAGDVHKSLFHLGVLLFSFYHSFFLSYFFTFFLSFIFWVSFFWSGLYCIVRFFSSSISLFFSPLSLALSLLFSSITHNLSLYSLSLLRFILALEFPFPLSIMVFLFSHELHQSPSNHVGTPATMSGTKTNSMTRTNNIPTRHIMFCFVLIVKQKYLFLSSFNLLLKTDLRN